MQSKGEEVSEFFLYVLQQLEDAYVDLRLWLSEIGFSPSQLIRSKIIINTDPGRSQRSRTIGMGMKVKEGTGVWKHYHTVAQVGITM